jgi:hypothetical protein
MPTQRTTRANQPSKTPTRATTNRKAPVNGSKATTFFEMQLTTETFLAPAGGDNNKSFDLVACSRCASLIPDSAASKRLHGLFHEQLNGIDQRTTR